jgi:hypothetical protein
MTIEVIKDCFCEAYLHELLRYYRPGLVEKKFKKGEQFDVVEKWQNFYGTYYRIKVDGKSHDIDIDKCKIIAR